MFCLTHQTKVWLHKHVYAYAYKSLAIQTHSWVKICIPNLEHPTSSTQPRVPCPGALCSCPVFVPCASSSALCLSALSQCPVSQCPVLECPVLCPVPRSVAPPLPCAVLCVPCARVPCVSVPCALPCPVLCPALCSALQRLTKKLRLVVDLRQMLVYSRVDLKPTTRSANNEDRT